MKALRDYKLEQARDCIKRGDLAKALDWLSDPQTAEERELAAKCRYAGAEKLVSQGSFQAALEGLKNPTEQRAREIAAQCYYGLLKRAASEADWQQAKQFARSALALSPASPSIRHFINARMRLMDRPPPPAEEAPHQRFVPGTVSLDGFVGVPVLGHHGSWGTPTDLNRLVGLLKMAEVELDTAEQQARPLLVSLAGLMLAGLLRLDRSAERVDLIVPVPQEASRYASRGFSPQYLLAGAIAGHLRAPLETDLLLKTRDTRPLHELQQWARADELKGAFAVAESKSNLVKDGVVLVVDDVVTWGTTFREAKRVLEAAGAKEVQACALATGRDNLVPTRAARP